MNKISILFILLFFCLCCFASNNDAKIEMKLVLETNYSKDKTDSSSIAVKCFSLKNTSSDVLWVRLLQDETKALTMDDLYQELFKYSNQEGGRRLMFSLDPNITINSFHLFGTGGLIKRMKPEETFSIIVFDYKNNASTFGNRFDDYDIPSLSNNIQIFNEQDIISYRKSGELLRHIDNTNKVMFFQGTEVFIPIDWLR